MQERNYNTWIKPNKGDIMTFCTLCPSNEHKHELGNFLILRSNKLLRKDITFDRTFAKVWIWGTLHIWHQRDNRV